ncbi:hypothetical protein G9P44_002865 [Scheffersomyces stipitis]|nr:hypothetical protein G9P44_002865 [Scheffersomyces stipitis]
MKYFRFPPLLHGGEVHTVDIDPTNEWLATGGLDHIINIWKLSDLVNLARISPLEKNEDNVIQKENGFAINENNAEARIGIPENPQITEASIRPVEIIDLDEDDKKDESKDGFKIDEGTLSDRVEIKELKVNTVDTKSDNLNNEPTKIENDHQRHSVSSDNIQTSQDSLTSKVNSISPVYTLKTHKAVVSTIKFSPKNSKELVSADTKGNIYLHNLEKNSQTLLYPFNEEQKASVVDLSWSMDSRLVAWSTIEGKVNVIDVTKNTFQELTELTHLEKLTVQRSIAFDPTNNYLITLGDDTLVYLYQYTYDTALDNYQFRLINKISRLINKNPINVNYKRISWSPEGELLSVPTASKNQTSLISLISRSKNWQNRISLVGHGLACEVVRFHPKFLREGTDDTAFYNVIATGGSDKTLAIWNTSKDTPVVVLQDVVDKPILDLVWDKTGTSLIVATLDGHLGIASIENNELGHEISQDMLEELKKFDQEYIKPINHKYEHDQSTTRRGEKHQIELLDQKDAKSTIHSEQNEEKDQNKDESSEKEANSSPTNSQPEAISNGPIEPSVIPPPNMTEPDTSATDILHSAMSSRQSKSTTSKTTKTAKTTSIASASSITVPPSDSKSAQKQEVTTKNGKRRIQPMLISNNGTTKPAIASSESSLGNNSTVQSSSKSLMEFDKPSYSVEEDFYKQNKRLKAQEEAGSNKKIKRELEPVKFIGSVITNPNTTFSKVRLSVPKVRLNFQISSKFDGEVFIMDIKNGTGNETKPSRITYFKKDKQLWCDFIPRYIQLAVEGSNFWALSTSDGQILTYSHTSGKRLLPPLVLGSPVSFLESHSKYLMAVTSLGELFVWDLEKKKIELSTSLTPLLELSSKYHEDGLSKSDNITLCAVTSAGIPLVTLSNCSGYLFNKNLCIWQTITESWWSFGSHYWESNDENSKKPQTSNLFGEEASIIELLEHKTNEEIIRKTRTGRGKYFNKISKNMIMKEGFENLENTISISHLENRILCCELLGEFKDFRRFFLTYVQRICELGYKTKLFEVCDELLGPDSQQETDVNSRSASGWSSSICGVDKHELLKEVILLCAKHRDAQRILIHFGKKIGVVNDVL